MAEINQLTEEIIAILAQKGVIALDNEYLPVGISNRHIHLSQADLETCFGKGYQLTVLKELSQPGQFAAKETVTIVGAKGAIEKVRVLGPVRSRSQVEVFASDNYKLGIKAPLKISGDLDGAAPITIVGTQGSVHLEEAAIVAKRHIHMLPSDAERFGVKHGDSVKIKVFGERGGIYNNVIIRVSDKSRLDLHIDMEEANAMGVDENSKIIIVKHDNEGGTNG